MTSSQKGYNAQKKSEQLLAKLGFSVHTVTRSAHKGMAHDFFGLWDHIAISPNPITVGGLTVPAKQTLYVQTKSSKIYGKQLLPFLEFPALYKLIIVWKKGENGRYYNIFQQLKEQDNVQLIDNPEL